MSGPSRAGPGSTGVWAVIAAAGQGERLGSPYPKAFAKLGGRPLLAESIDRLDASEWIEAIVVVTPEGWEEPVILLAEELGAGKVSAAVTGGATRAESVRIGLADVPDEAAVVLVHDAARPLVSGEVIDRVLAPLGEGWDGAVPALPVSDTLKRAAPDGGVLETVDRTGLHSVQTPQAFLAPVLRRAFTNADAGATDCAVLVEAAGGRVRLVGGDARLLKVTTSADLALVEAFLTGP
jgi:2-C-methyl-D-erythritol 4-phosphate cytidylyltransferase